MNELCYALTRLSNKTKFNEYAYSPISCLGRWPYLLPRSNSYLNWIHRDIKKIPKALDKVKELSGYTYTINEKQSAGVIAQEVLKILPETVITKDDGYYGVTYHGLIGLLIEAVKELSEKVK